MRVLHLVSMPSAMATFSFCSDVAAPRGRRDLVGIVGAWLVSDPYSISAKKAFIASQER